MKPDETMSERRGPGDTTTISLHPRVRPGNGGERVEFGALSHVGKVRAKNEDQYLVARATKSLHILHTSVPPDEGSRLSRDAYLLLVADGMGGHAAGERASAIVVEEAERFIMDTARWFYRPDDPDEETRVRLIRQALERVDRRLVEEGKHDPSVAGMGTTVTTAAVIGPDVFIVHVGDSRAYRFRDGRLEQQTTDHTLVNAMVEKGYLLPEEARTHPMRHVLTNVVGGTGGVEGQFVKLRLADGDRLLLCTDGLTDLVTPAAIAEALTRYPQPPDACQALVDLALERGGRDNITVVLAAYSTGDEP